jgi:uncharacterized membrane protein
MNDTNQAPQGQPAGSPTLPKEVEEGRTFAILSYALSLIGLPFFLVPLIMRNNEYSLYHAKQCLLLWIAGIATSIVSIPLMAICIGFLFGPAVGIFLLVLDIFGLINAVKGEQKPIPVIGKYAEDWFKGLKKA